MSPSPATGLPTLVHIGYHKTASTWLQGQLFLPRFGFQRYPRAQIARAFIEPGPFSFDAPAWREEIDAWRDEILAAGLVPVLSHERLSGYPHSGGFDSLEIAERLATVLPDARILIVVREQRSMILSNYHQYVRDGGACPVGRYLQPPQPSMRRLPGFAADFFAYDRLIESYRSHFGAANVCVLAYEQFVATPDRFLERIGTLAELGRNLGGLHQTAGTVVNSSALSPLTLGALRRVNLLFRANALHVAPPLASRTASALGTRFAFALNRLPTGTLAARISARERALIARRVEGVYEESNVHLSALAGFDAGALGYAVPGS